MTDYGGEFGIPISDLPDQEFQPGDTVTLTGAKAERLLRESGLNPQGVVEVKLTRSEIEGRWHLNARYESNDALMKAHGIHEGCSGLVAATHEAAPECFHRKTTLVGLVLSERLMANGRLVRPGSKIIESRVTPLAEDGDGELRLTLDASSSGLTLEAD